jgi:hypothetical protein
VFPWTPPPAAPAHSEAYGQAQASISHPLPCRLVQAFMALDSACWRVAPSPTANTAWLSIAATAAHPRDRLTTSSQSSPCFRHSNSAALLAAEALALPYAQPAAVLRAP